MNWPTAKLIAAKHLAEVRRGLEAQGFIWPDCLKGRPVPLADYATDADLRQVKPEEPGLNLHAQRLINRAALRLFAKLGAKPFLVTLDPAAYLRWLTSHSLPNNASNRARYIGELAQP